MNTFEKETHMMNVAYINISDTRILLCLKGNDASLESR